MATTPRFTAAPDWPYGMKLEVITKMATQLRTDYQRTVRDFLDLQVRGSMDSSGVVEQLRRALSVHGEAQPEALEAGLNTLATSDLQAHGPACANTNVSYRRTKRSNHRARCITRVSDVATRRAIRRDAPRRARTFPFAPKGIHCRAGAVSPNRRRQTYSPSRPVGQRHGPSQPWPAAKLACAAQRTATRLTPSQADPRREEEAHEGPSAQKAPGVHTMTGVTTPPARTRCCAHGPDAFRLDRPSIRTSFDRASAHYEAAAVLQAQVNQELMSRLEFFKFQPRSGPRPGHRHRPRR